MFEPAQLSIVMFSVQSGQSLLKCRVTSDFAPWLAHCSVSGDLSAQWSLKATILLTISQLLCWSEVTTKQVGIQPPDTSLDAHEIDILNQNNFNAMKETYIKNKFLRKI